MARCTDCDVNFLQAGCVQFLDFVFSLRFENVGENFDVFAAGTVTRLATDACEFLGFAYGFLVIGIGDKVSTLRPETRRVTL